MKILRALTMIGLSTLVMNLNTGCGSCSNTWNDISRDINKKDYHITLYDCEGKIIIEKDLPNTFIQVSENGSGIRYTENGKLRMLNGTYILEEK